MRNVVERIVRNCVNCILADKKTGRLEGYLNPIFKRHVPLATYLISSWTISFKKKNITFLLSWMHSQSLYDFSKRDRPAH